MPSQESDSVVASNMSCAVDIDKYLTSYIGRNRNLALLLDYDGTLAPIHADPNFSKMTVETKNLLEKLSLCQNIFIAIVSGRHCENAKEMAEIDSITYAGSHGFEILYPDGSRYEYPVPKEYSDTMERIRSDLEKEVTRDGAWVEAKVNDLTFHYQETPKELVPGVKEDAEKVIRRHGFEPNQALDALEILPPIDWHKGHAAQHILKHKFGDNYMDSVKIIYAGDESADEKFMEMFQGKAATFRISAEPVKTFAGYTLKSMNDVPLVLKWIENNFCQN